MKIEVYCDESHPELFTTTKKPLGRYLMIGSLWLPSDYRAELKAGIDKLKNKHSIGSEFKWHKVHKDKIDFYCELVDLFFDYEDNVRFRCIAVDSKQFTSSYHQKDPELGFYKFYYQLLHHWIRESNEYLIFCDQKSNSDPKRLHKLTEVLQQSKPAAIVNPIQALPSWQVTLIQLSDFLLGAATAKQNNSVTKGSAKETVLLHIEKSLNRTICASNKAEKKFNLFCIDLRGDW